LLLWRGLISLVIGLLFLVVCLWLRQLIGLLAGAAGTQIVSEGLLILGWVAMWRPVEIFLYDWWPEFGKRRLFLRIVSMNIDVRRAQVDMNERISLCARRTVKGPSTLGAKRVGMDSGVM
jgi:hypothetical protein